MNDLEERLRADLQLAAAEVEDSIDVDSALSAGRRARRSRLIARTVGVTALVAVFGLVGWTALRSAPPLAGVPAPMQTVPAVPSAPATPSDPLVANFELRDSGLNRWDPAYESIKVAARPAGDEVAVTLTLSKAGRQPVLRQFTIEAGTSWHVALDEHMVLGIVPDRTTWIDVADDAKLAVVSQKQPLDGIGATAIWLGYEEAGEPDTLRGFIWEGDDGLVRDSLGTDVPSARVSIRGGSYLIYRDTALDRVAAKGPDSNASFRISESEPGDLVGGGFGSRNEATEFWRWSQLGSLPPGSRDVQVELAEPDGEWRAVTLDDGWVVVIAFLMSKSDKGEVIRSITYTDAVGKVVTYPK